jgi:hypothetical protein
MDASALAPWIELHPRMTFSDEECQELWNPRPRQPPAQDVHESDSDSDEDDEGEWSSRSQLTGIIIYGTCRVRGMARVILGIILLPLPFQPFQGRDYGNDLFSRSY